MESLAFSAVINLSFYLFLLIPFCLLFFQFSLIHIIDMPNALKPTQNVNLKHSYIFQHFAFIYVINKI